MSYNLQVSRITACVHGRCAIVGSVVIITLSLGTQFVGCYIPGELQTYIECLCTLCHPPTLCTSYILHIADKGSISHRHWCNCSKFSSLVYLWSENASDTIFDLPQNFRPNNHT
ncbi:hypothetical protein CEXT_561541 [Caerostris extrusa]|uniref:Uncharacterized protein n=1 Tax=Caerostris extrusa TaxID=172846 RepID=A0AAV4TIW2_CAEEX|nr:hypothetical protein CEXT_561541 [Caerostris extrusa]